MMLAGISLATILQNTQVSTPSPDKMTAAMSRRPTSLTVRLTRILRLAGHLARGLWIVHTRYPRLAPRAQDRELERWSRRLLAILRVEVRCHNAPAALPERCLLVTNHISWLDIFAVYAVAPSVFVAKSDIREWPLVGTLVERVGTLFIERGNRRHAHATNGRVAAALEAGRLVAVCPEGTTTDGRSLKHFHPALLQPAIDARAMVLPAALRYLDADGVQTDAAAYVGEDSLVGSIWRIAAEPAMAVELRFVPCVNADGMRRRGLARVTHDLIAHELGLPPAHRPSGTAGDPRAGSPSGDPPTRSPCPAPANPG
jgi:1-acyl-sn-glycerol-3-phosphate acyltransferase